MKRLITLIAMVLMFSGCYTQLGTYSNADMDIIYGKRVTVCNEWGYQCYTTRIRPGTSYLYERVYRPHTHTRYKTVYKVKSKPKATQRKHRRSERTYNRRGVGIGGEARRNPRSATRTRSTTRRNTRATTTTRKQTTRSTTQKSRPSRGRNGVKRKTRTE